MKLASALPSVRRFDRKVKVPKEPEAGRHPSYPVVERSWDAVFALFIRYTLIKIQKYGSKRC